MPRIYGSSEIWGDLLITGSFSILGSASSIYTTTLVVSDTIIALGHSQSGSPVLDEGIMFTRGTGLTQAFIWDETNDTFALIGTNDDHTVIGSVNIDSYSNLRVGGLTTSTLKISNGASSGYILQSDSSGNATWVILPGGLTGSGTTNYVSKWTASGTLGNSSIYDNGSTIGIGLIPPAGRRVQIDQANNDVGLYIGGNSTAVGNISLFAQNDSTTVDTTSIYAWNSRTTGTGIGIDVVANSSSGSTNIAGRFTAYSGIDNYAIFTDKGKSVFNDSSDDYDFQIKGDTDTNLFYVDASTDRIGIGTNGPSSKLTIAGGIYAYGNGNLARVDLLDLLTGADVTLTPQYTSGIPAIQTSGAFPLSLVTNGSERIRITSAGLVGVGTITPIYNFEVSGTVSTTGFRMTDGASQDYILSSDSTGVASWTSSESVQENGVTTIQFDRPRVYNTRLSALTGALTADLTNSKLGMIQKIYHNDGSTPTLSGATWSLLSGTYTPSTLNIIYAEWVTSAEIEYWII